MKSVSASSLNVLRPYGADLSCPSCSKHDAHYDVLGDNEIAITADRDPNSFWYSRGPDLMAASVGFFLFEIPSYAFGGPELGALKAWGGRAAVGAATQGIKIFERNALKDGFRNVAVLQKGGRTIKNGTVRALNQNLAEELGREPTKGQWKQALEGLKKREGLDSDHHGWIHDTGEYTDSNGTSYGFLQDYLP